MNETGKGPLEQNFLEALREDWGIGLTPVDIDEARKKPGWKKLEEDGAAQVLDALRVVPGLSSNQAIRDNFSGAVRLVIPEGMPENTYFGLRRGLGNGVHEMSLRSSDTGQVVKQAGWVNIDPSQANLAQVAYGVFSAASVVTGQYFMQRIDKKLEGIQRSANDIKEFLELDKYCALKAQWTFLQETFENMMIINRYDVQRQAASVSAQAIIQSALADMLFYHERADLRGNDLDPKLNGSKLEELIEEIAKNVAAYWFSLHVYSLATVLELSLTGNRDERYLAAVHKNLEHEQEQYSACFSLLHEKMDTTIGAWDRDKFLFDIAKGTAKEVPILGPVLTDKVDEAHKATAEKKRQKKMRLIEDKLNECRDLAQLKSMSDSVATLNRLSHQPTELIVDGSEIYLHVEEPIAPEAAPA